MGQQQSNAKEQAKMAEFFSKAARDEYSSKGPGKSNAAQRRQMQVYLEEAKKDREEDVNNVYLKGCGAAWLFCRLPPGTVPKCVCAGA